MRTMLQALNLFPDMTQFCMNILLQTISKKVWRIPDLWVGFIKICEQVKEQAYFVLLQLPRRAFASALDSLTDVSVPLLDFARINRMNVSRDVMEYLRDKVDELNEKDQERERNRERS